jgi:hypothetical protein
MVWALLEEPYSNGGVVFLESRQYIVFHSGIHVNRRTRNPTGNQMKKATYHFFIRNLNLYVSKNTNSSLLSGSTCDKWTWVHSGYWPMGWPPFGMSMHHSNTRHSDCSSSMYHHWHLGMPTKHSRHLRTMEQSGQQSRSWWAQEVQRSFGWGCRYCKLPGWNRKRNSLHTCCYRCTGIVQTWVAHTTIMYKRTFWSNFTVANILIFLKKFNSWDDESWAPTFVLCDDIALQSESVCCRTWYGIE